METATKDPEVQEPETDDVEGEDDGEEVDGWLIVYVDGEHQIVAHPEDRTREEVVKDFFESKKKQHHAFLLNGWVFDTNTIRAFGWERDCEHPQIERFDGLQDTLEGLMGAMGEVIEQQQALQAAQAFLIQNEMDEEMEEGFEAAQAQAMAAQAMAAPRPAPRAASKPSGKPSGKKGFRPPGR